MTAGRPQEMQQYSQTSLDTCPNKLITAAANTLHSAAALVHQNPSEWARRTSHVFKYSPLDLQILKCGPQSAQVCGIIPAFWCLAHRAYVVLPQLGERHSAVVNITAVYAQVHLVRCFCFGSKCRLGLNGMPSPTFLSALPQSQRECLRK